MPEIYLSSFNPICSTNAGIKAANTYNLPYFIDGSCRREPDFENEMPCITSLCRPGFAQKLEINDIVIYVTNRKGVGSRKVVAALKVIRSFSTHDEAASWYSEKQLPNNLIVLGNDPKPIECTHRNPGSIIKKLFSNNELNNLELWDRTYHYRSRLNPSLKQCEILYLNLKSPLEIIEHKFGRPLVAQNPPKLNDQEIRVFQELLNIQF
ncbi:hypothetical protein [Fluviicola sp.]|uniref:hypothetical protein n=1 Tax=Fluviicola sp. TaxID=1917219 RepID=UPI003D2A86B6